MRAVDLVILRKRSWRLAFRRRAAARKGTTQGRIETYSLPPNYVLVGSQDVQTIIGWTILKVSETDTSSPPLSNNMSDVVSGQERRSFSVCWHARSRTFLTCWQISTGRGGAGNTRPSPSRILDPSNVPKCERGHEISLRCVRQASLHAHHTWMMMTGHPLWPRGGVGNIQCPIHDPDDAVYEVHEEALPGESVGGTTGRQNRSFSSGRGGAGNNNKSKSKSKARRRIRNTLRILEHTSVRRKGTIGVSGLSPRIAGMRTRLICRR